MAARAAVPSRAAAAASRSVIRLRPRAVRSFEIAHCQLARLPLALAVPPSERDAFRRALTVRRRAAGQHRQLYADPLFDARSAEATLESDRIMILKLISASFGRAERADEPAECSASAGRRSSGNSRWTSPARDRASESERGGATPSGACAVGAGAAELGRALVTTISFGRAAPFRRSQSADAIAQRAGPYGGDGESRMARERDDDDDPQRGRDGARTTTRSAAARSAQSVNADERAFDDFNAGVRRAVRGALAAASWHV